jgi:hypothetical protein
MDTVDDQLDALEDSLRVHLLGTFVFNFDLVQWAAANAPAADDLVELERIFREIFQPIVRTYNGTKVAEILHRCRLVLSHVAWAAINIPIPNDFPAHFNSVVENIITVYVALFYADLRTEMIMVNHSSQVIQRGWKHAVSNPRHSVCRRRLLHEFDALTSA